MSLIQGLRNIVPFRVFGRTMSTAVPEFKPFSLALVQLGQIGSDKHGLWNFLTYVPGSQAPTFSKPQTRQGDGVESSEWEWAKRKQTRPCGAACMLHRVDVLLCYYSSSNRNALTHRMDTYTSLSTQRRYHLLPAKLMTWRNPRVNLSGCCRLPQRRPASGFWVVINPV